MTSKGPQKPKPGWLNKQDMAASLGISVQAFAAWKVEPIARIGREAFFTAAAVVENRVSHQAERLRRDQTEGAVSQLDLERQLLIKEQREGQAMKNAELRREFAPVAAVEWALNRVSSQLSAQLDALPQRLKKAVPSLSAGVIEQITREVVKTKNSAARITVDLDEYRREHQRS